MNIRLLAGLGIAASLAVPSPCLTATNAPPPATADAPAAAARPFTIGVVSDGNCAYFDGLTRLMQEELRTLIGGPREVRFKAPPEFNAGWDLARVEPALDAALQDPEVNLVFAAGVVSAEAATRADRVLKKPVVSGFVQDPDAVGLPYDKDGRSTKRNFNFVVVPLRSTRDMEVFRQMVPFRRLGLVADAFLLDGLPSIREYVAAGEKDYGITVTILPAERSAQPILDHLPPRLDAVYLTPALRMDDAEWQRLIDGLNARRLPTFSLMGHRDVDRGALAGLSPECDDRLSRRLALNIQQIMEGTPPEQLQVPMALDERLEINAATAAQIGYAPSFEIMIQARLLHADLLETGAAITLEDALRMGLEHNLNLAVQRLEVERSRADRNLAGSALWPQVDGRITRTQVDTDRAEASLGSLPEQQSAAGFSLTQVLINDPVLTQFRAARRVFLSAEETYAATRYDVMASVATAYIQFLQARALLRIEGDNLALTMNNLDLARMRHHVGNTGPEEVYRWEAQAASQKAKTIAADAGAAQAEVALNQALGLPLGGKWQPRDMVVREGEYHFLDSRIRARLTNERQLKALRQVVVQTALERAPELKALDRSLEAQRLTVAQYRRRFVLPELTLSYAWDRVMMEKTVTGAAAAGTASSGSEADRNEWTLAVQASLPLFRGGGKLFDLRKAQAQMNQLEETRRRTAQSVEQRARNVMLSLESTYPSMQLQQTAADFARRNLDVIKDKYARGAVSILDLLDAQNQSFVASQNAAIAVYSYLRDVYEMQRAMAWYEADQSEAEKDAWAAAFEALLDQSATEGSEPNH